MFSYLWYGLRLSFQVSGPITVGATMQMEGYTDDEIDDMEQFIARDLIIRWTKLFREAPPSHLHPDGLKVLQEHLKEVLVPSLRELHDLKTILAKHKGSRWLNSKVEDVIWHVERYRIRPENILQDESPIPGKVTSS